MQHMHDAGQIHQDGENQIVLNAAGGAQRFDVEDGLQEIVVDFQDDN